MAMNGIEFGMKSSMGGMSGLNTDRMREMREQIQTDKATPGDKSEGASFGDYLKDLAREANSSQLVADGKMQEVAAGRNKDLHGAVLAMEKAEVNFKLLSQVRNKVIEAYREIMRMQV